MPGKRRRSPVLKNAAQILKLLCLLLAALLAVQIVRVIARGTPLKNLTVPALPKLASSANESTNSPSGTNASSATNNSSATNVAAGTKPGTNDSTTKKDAQGTNAIVDSKASGTNNVPKSETGSKGTNAAKAEVE